MRRVEHQSAMAVAGLLFIAIASAALAGQTVFQGNVHCDIDHSSTLTPGDVPLNGVTVRISDGASTLGETTTPDAVAPGHYFANVAYVGPGPISATVEMVDGIPQGATFVYPPDGAFVTLDFLLAARRHSTA